MERLKILLAGMVAGDPWQGGATWAVLQYLLGLQRLGHDVLLVEPIEAASLRPHGSTLARSESASYFGHLPLVGHDAGAALLLAGGEETVGAPYSAVLEFARDADLLLDISGMLSREERLLELIPVRAFVDLDPGFNQVWHETGADVGLAAHNRFVTVGQAIGTPTCPIPTCGVSWIPTLPPVVLEHWPAAGAPRRDAFTTVGHWRSYGPIEHGGIHYGQRAHSLRELISLPGRSGARFELALGIHADETQDLEALDAAGWELLDPVEVAGTPDRYRDFIASSKAELGVAKSGYVASRSAWFSDRSACYLASGRPVIAQETGFSEFLPVGEGLLTFSSVEEAAAAIDEVKRDWGRHSRAARVLAAEHLDSDRVLGRLIDRLGSAP
jgi:hypothetical protein